MTATPHPTPPDPALLAQRDALLAALPNDKLRALVATLRPDAPLAWALLFPKTEGLGSAGDVKRRVRLLQSIESRLPTLLFPGEVVEFVTTGMLNSFLEQYFMGIWAYAINRRLFVFTNMRVVLISSDNRGRAKVQTWQIPYERLQKYGAGTLSGAVTLKTIGGKSSSFVGVPGADRKRLKQYMTARLEQTRQQGNPFPSYADQDSLCIHCASPIPPRAPACPDCGDPLIDPIKPALMSLAVPGLGHLYIGHRLVGIIEMLGFLILLANLAIMASRSGVVGAMFGVVVIVIANTVDFLVTLHVAKKGAVSKSIVWKEA